MPSAQYFQRLKTAFEATCQRAFYSLELKQSASGWLKRGNLLSLDIPFLYSSCVDSLTSVAGLRNFSRFSQSSNTCLDQTVDQGKALSVSEALSRMFAIPSVYGPSWQACEYHAHVFLVGNSPLSSSKYSTKTLSTRRLLGRATTYNSKAAVSDLGNPRLEGIRTSVKITSSALSLHCRIHNRNDSFNRCLQIASFHSIGGNSNCGGNEDKSENGGPREVNLVSGLFAFHIFKTGAWLQWVWRPGAKGFHSSSSFFNTARAAREISFNNSAKDDNVDDSSTTSDQTLLGDRVLKLQSGSCYLPHPDKEETGGEDAHFICTAEQAIGVADGVGGWAQMGVNSGEYARELMTHSVVAIQEEPRGSIDLSRVLEKAYMSTKSKGSSTACILALTDQGLHAVNLGDSGFVVVRDGCTVFRSPVQQHDFNFTFQLESGDGSDLPSSAQVFTLQVAPGDVIIAGTDGLFDNLYNSEVTAVVVHAQRAGLAPQVTAQKIAALARQRAQDKNRQTPFSTAAQDAGFRYYGGKLDDITVVVSYVASSNPNQED
uniref:Protein phosphatase n=1 Tax=Araucaria cunninghamii TaxID=56994 RepID=A0A0D6QZ40_ARACU